MWNHERAVGQPGNISPCYRNRWCPSAYLRERGLGLHKVTEAPERHVLKTCLSYVLPPIQHGYCPGPFSSSSKQTSSSFQRFRKCSSHGGGNWYLQIPPQIMLKHFTCSSRFLLLKESRCLLYKEWDGKPQSMCWKERHFIIPTENKHERLPGCPALTWLRHPPGIWSAWLIQGQKPEAPTNFIPEANGKWAGGLEKQWLPNYQGLCSRLVGICRLKAKLGDGQKHLSAPWKRLPYLQLVPTTSSGHAELLPQNWNFFTVLSKHSPSLCSIGLLQEYSPKSCTPRTLPWFMLLRLSVIRLIAALLRHWYTTRCIVKSNKYSSHAHTHLLQKQKMIKSRKY